MPCVARPCNVTTLQCNDRAGTGLREEAVRRVFWVARGFAGASEARCARAQVVVCGIDLRPTFEQHLEQVEASAPRQLAQLARRLGLIVTCETIFDEP